MPQSQVAKRDVYDFGAPAAEAVVLKFRVPRGGKLDLNFENSEGVADGEVTVQVSEDGVTYADTTAAANLVAVANEAVQRGCRKSFAGVLLREGLDNYMQVQALGGCRMNLQMVKDQNLEIVQI
jgi:hypothetical protein